MPLTSLQPAPGPARGSRSPSLRSATLIRGRGPVARPAQPPGLCAAEAEAIAAAQRLLSVLQAPRRDPKTSRKAADNAYLAIGYLAAVLRRPKR